MQRYNSVYVPLPLTLPFLSLHYYRPHLDLHSAAANANVGLVKYALSHGQPINSVLDGALPVHAASSGGNDLVVRLLIEQGADGNASRYVFSSSPSSNSNIYPSLTPLPLLRPPPRHLCLNSRFSRVHPPPLCRQWPQPTLFAHTSYTAHTPIE